MLSMALLFCTQICFGWGQNGHRITAQICYDNLNEKAKRQIDSILGDEFLTQVATWPDFIRSEKNWDFAKDWHHVTINPGQTAEEVLKASKSNDTVDNVLEAIEFMQSILRGDKTAIANMEALMKKNGVTPLGGSTQATAIAFLVHFIGDVHQPMHVGKDGDFGGNSISVLFFNERTNLHSVWDEGIIQQEQLSFTEFAEFVNKHQLSHKGEWEKDKLTEWAMESVEYRDSIYATLYTSTDKSTGLPSLSYQYQHDYVTVVEARLGAGGYRAAQIFNSIYK